MIAHHHELTVPSELRVTQVADIVIAHDARTREYSVFIYPITQLPVEQWIYRVLSDGPAHTLASDDCILGAHRCKRVTSTHAGYRRVIVFVETHDGSDGWLPIVLLAHDARHDQVIEELVASVRATRTHPFQMWID